MEFFIRPTVESDMPVINHYINKYGLDNENLDYCQFLTAEVENELAGFGRIKQYCPNEDLNKNLKECELHKGGDCHHIYELASIGVVKKFRKNHIGKKLILTLLYNCRAEEIWLTTIIPEYFKQFGFKEEDNIPDEILLKCGRVCEKLNKTTQNSHYMCLKKLNLTIK